MIALISDIHANFEALCAVISDIQARDVSSIVCLGDLVGYGPDPEKCVDLVMQEARLSIMGNHDYALLNVPFGFNPLAAEVIRKTQEIMRPGPETGNDRSDTASQRYYTCSRQNEMPRCIIMEQSKSTRWEFMQNLAEKSEEENALYVHGSPLDTIFEYIFPPLFEKIWDPRRIEVLFRSVGRFCFCGHTHIPCAIASDLTCIYPQECGYKLVLDVNKKYFINTGSVGQPRDRDNRACYLLFDEKNNTVEWRRLEYDIRSVVEKSEKMCGTGNWCGARLWEGR
jgi:predicted phosphodiesterase